ncbi:MAG: uroporphyrinogen-III synthase [Pseudomonadota bacterium]
MASGPLVLVTRTAPGCEDTAARLETEGYQPIVSPALEIAALSTSLPDLTGTAGLIFTSANGVRAFALRSDRRDTPAWCVGPATTDAANEEGFTRVRNADGDAENLADFIAGNADPAAGALLHVANDAAAGNLVGSLRDRGFDATFAALYTTRPAEQLSDEARTAFGASKVAAVLIHSAKGAWGFAGLAKGLDLTDITCVAISARAAAPADALKWREISVAGAPNEDALINALRMACPPD